MDRRSQLGLCTCSEHRPAHLHVAVPHDDPSPAGGTLRLVLAPGGHLHQDAEALLEDAPGLDPLQGADATAVPAQVLHDSHQGFVKTEFIFY